MHIGDALITLALLLACGFVIGWMWRQVSKMIEGRGRL